MCFEQLNICCGGIGRQAKAGKCEWCGEQLDVDPKKNHIQRDMGTDVRLCSFACGMGRLEASRQRAASFQQERGQGFYDDATAL